MREVGLGDDDRRPRGRRARPPPGTGRSGAGAAAASVAEATTSSRSAFATARGAAARCRRRAGAWSSGAGSPRPPARRPRAPAAPPGRRPPAARPAICGTHAAPRAPRPSTHTVAVGPDTRSTTPSWPAPPRRRPGSRRSRRRLRAARPPRTARGAGLRRAPPRPPRGPPRHGRSPRAAATTTPPAWRAFSTAVTRDPPLVSTSSTTATGVPSSMNGPSIHCWRPCFLASLRTKKPVTRSPARPGRRAHRAHQGVGAEREAAHRARRRRGEGRPGELAGEGRALGIEQHLARVEVARGAAPGRQHDRLAHEGALAQQMRQAGGGVGRGGHPGSLVGERAVADRRRTPSRGAGNDRRHSRGDPQPERGQVHAGPPGGRGAQPDLPRGLGSGRVAARRADLRPRRRHQRVHGLQLRERHEGGRRRLERARCRWSSTSSRPTSERRHEPHRSPLLVRDRR